MKKIILMIVLLLSTITIAQTSVQQVKDGVETFKSLNKEVSSLKQNVLKNDFKIENKNPGFLSKTTDGVSTVYNDSKEGVSTLYNDVKSLAPDAKYAIKEIYDTLKNTSKYVWELLVRQQTVWAFGFLIGNLLFLWTLYRFWKSLDKVNNDRNETGETKFIHYIPLIYFGAASILLGILSVQHFEPMLTGFFNPEFGALRNLIELGKNLK
jgi:hypothetical protein